MPAKLQPPILSLSLSYTCWKTQTKSSGTIPELLPLKLCTNKLVHDSSRFFVQAFMHVQTAYHGRSETLLDCHFHLPIWGAGI